MASAGSAAGGTLRAASRAMNPTATSTTAMPTSWMPRTDSPSTRKAHSVDNPGWASCMIEMVDTGTRCCDHASRPWATMPDVTTITAISTQPLVDTSSSCPLEIATGATATAATVLMMAMNTLVSMPRRARLVTSR